MSDGPIHFDRYCLDPADGRLSRAGRPVPLTPKAFDVLLYLASRRGRLVTKDELLTAVWGDVIVGGAALKVCVREAPKALGDAPARPRYVETVHRRGYRFIAPVGPPAGGKGDGPLPTFVGREAELAQ